MQAFIFGNKMISIGLENLYNTFMSLPPGQHFENSTLIYDADVPGDFFIKYNPKKIVKLSSGEGININIKHKENYYIPENTAKLVLASNDALKLNSSFDNGGFDRRYYELVFKKNWVRKQTKLYEKFIKDDEKKSQYFSYILQGLEMFKNRNDTQDFFPVDKERELERKKEAEPIIEYLSDNYVKTDKWSDVIQFKDILDDFNKFKEEKK